MNRKDFLKTAAMLSMTGTAVKLSSLGKLAEELPNTERMPVLFVGHGSPMNGIEENDIVKTWRTVAAGITKPTAILCISAHWETRGTFVTAMEKPRTIHDFGGFPQALFDAQYPAPGSKWLAEETQRAITSTTVGADESWGFDHGCWSILKPMYPNADIPVIQMSLDRFQTPAYHYELAKQLASLREKGVLIIGSGNMVHNLGRMAIKDGDFNKPYGHDWAIEANNLFKKYIDSNDHKPLTQYTSLGMAVQLSVPTPEHYLPMLYTLALKQEKEHVSYFNDVAMAGSITMTSLKIG